MHALKREIDTLRDTDPGLLPANWQQNLTEVRFRDFGSRRTANVALGAFGQLLAERRAREEVEATGDEFGTSPKSKQAVRNAKTRLAGLQREMDSAVYDGNGNNSLALELPDVDLLIDSVEALSKLPNPEEQAALGYYAVVASSLLDEAVLSVNNGQFRYEI